MVLKGNIDVVMS